MEEESTISKEEKQHLLKEITIEKHQNFLLKRQLEEEKSNLQATLKQLNLVRVKLKDEKETQIHLKEILNQSNLNILKYEKKFMEEQKKNLELLSIMDLESKKKIVSNNSNSNSENLNKSFDSSVSDSPSHTQIQNLEMQLNEEKLKNSELEQKISELTLQLEENIKLKNNAIKQYEEEKLNVELGNLTIESLQRQVKRLREMPTIGSPQTKVMQPRDDLEEEFEEMLRN